VIRSPAQGRQGLFATGAVVVVLAGVVFGGYVADAALSQPAGPPVTVAGVVRVSPLFGWVVARRFAQPPGVRFTRGVGNLDVLVVPFRGDPTLLAREFVEQILQPEAERLQVSRRTQVVQVSGRTGVRFAYVGVFSGVQSQLEGEVTGVPTGSGAVVVFDAWAPAGLLQYVAGDANTMIEQASLR
jgi:hypothetical protein